MAKDKVVKVDIEADKPKGQLEKLGLKDASDLAKQVMIDFNQAEQTKWLWIPERNQDVKDYFGITQSAEWPFKGASRIKSQFQRIIVDVLSGNLIKSLFSPEKPIKVEPSPLNAKDSDQTLSNLRYVEDLNNHLMRNEYKLREVLDKALPTAFIESFCVLHPVYEYMTNELILTVKRWVPKDIDAKTLTYDIDTDTVSTQDGQYVQSIDSEKGYDEDDVDYSQLQEITFDVEKEECTKDGISIKVINGYRFYMPLGSPGETPNEKIQRAPYLVHQLFYTIKEVRQLSEEGYFENIEPVIATVYDRQRELITYTKLTQAGFLLDTARLEYEYVEVLKWCGKWKIGGKWTNLIVWMDRGSSQILRAEINIFGEKPYYLIVPFPIDETPYGESLCKIIRPLVKEIDLLMRIITNIALQKSAPARFYDPASGFNPQTIGQFGPNAWIPAREPSRNVLIPPSPEDPRVAFEMLHFLINIVERITGVNEVIQGQISDRANTTAYEVNNAMQRAGVRFDSLYDRIKSQLKPLIKHCHRLTLRYMPSEKEIKLMGKENDGRLVKLHKEMLQGKFEFELAGGSVVQEQKELQNSLQLYQTLLQGPGLAYTSYKPESIYYLLYNIVKHLNPIAMDKILPTPDEVKSLERQRAKVQGQQEQMGMQMAQQGQQKGPSPEEMAMQMKAQELQMKQQSDQQKAQLQAQVEQQKMQIEAQKAQLELQIEKAKFEQDMRQSQEEHEVKLQQMRETENAKAEEKQENND